VEKPTEEILFGRPRRKYDDNNKVDIKEIGCKSLG
jgi:hypothetical protein